MPIKRPKFDIKSGDPCPYCKTGFILERSGKFGDFYACDRFPRCAFTQPISRAEETYEEFMERMSKVKTKKQEIDDCIVFD